MENVGSRRPKTPAPTVDNAAELKQATIAEDGAVTVKRSLLTRELVISQMDMDHLPEDMGTTLALQVTTAPGHSSPLSDYISLSLCCCSCRM